MKKWILSLFVCFVAVQGAFAMDFLWRDGGTNLASRSSDPFARLDRVARVDALPVQWARVGDGFRIYVEWGGEEWTCKDGTMAVPPQDLPKTISKLDLLLVLREMGKLEQFSAWLDASGLRMFWDAAQLMTTDHPLYEQALGSVQEALQITDEQRDEILRRIAK